MKRFLPLLLVSLILASCNKIVYNDTRSFNNSTWMRFEPETFEFSVKNIEKCYNIVATAKIDTTLYKGFDFPLVVDMQNDQGEHRNFYAQIPLFNKQGLRTGEIVDSYQIVSSNIKEYFFFNTSGKQTMAIKQGTHKYDLNGVVNFGLKVEQANMKLPK